MSSDIQLSLFGESNINQKDQIPTDGKIPIPTGTYNNMTELAQHCNQCQRCELGQTRTNAVVGRGNLKAPIMIVGEAPGQSEDETGLPFVGRSGQLLEKILASVNLTTEQDVYIGNINKCLDGYTRVITKAGSKRLNWIVKNQWSGEVASVTEHGQLVWKKVTGWYRSQL
ncbi:uracil-DNA glycosylase, partial [Nostoc piscinale]|uniref:uracil-DNA glycosylase n=1 Tax=Nostoc piscinale TaxID=224012 RepID=UPI0039A432A2